MEAIHKGIYFYSILMLALQKKNRWWGQSVRCSLRDRGTQIWILKMTQSHNQHWNQSCFYSRFDLSRKGAESSESRLNLWVYVCACAVCARGLCTCTHQVLDCARGNCVPPPPGTKEQGSPSLPFTLQLRLSQSFLFSSPSPCHTLSERSLCQWSTGFLNLFFW